MPPDLVAFHSLRGLRCIITLAATALAAVAGSIVIGGSPAAAYQRPSAAAPYVPFTHTSEVLTLLSGLTETFSVASGVGATSVIDTDSSDTFAGWAYTPADLFAGPTPIVQVRTQSTRSTPIV